MAQICKKGDESLPYFDHLLEKKWFIIPQDVEDAKAKGNSAFQKEFTEEALAYYTWAINKDPENFILYSNRSAASLQRNDFNAAVFDSFKCLRLNPKWVKGHWRCALALIGLKEYEKAIPPLERILAEEPNNKDAERKLHEVKMLMKEAKAKEQQEDDDDEEDDDEDDDDDYDEDDDQDDEDDELNDETLAEMMKQANLKSKKGTGPNVAQFSGPSGFDHLLKMMGGGDQGPGSWCEGMEPKRAYKRFIDSYRLRLDDDYTQSGDVHGLYAQEDPLQDFKVYIRKAKKRNVLPKWWSDEHEKKLIHMATHDKWANIKYAVEKSDITEHYSYQSMEHMALRNLAKQVYGSGPGMW